MRSRQVSLPRVRWRTTPGSSRARGQPGIGQALQLGDVVEHRKPASVAVDRRRRRRRWPTSAGATTATTWPAPSSWSPGCRSRRPTTAPRARRGHDGLHLHRADHEQTVAGAHEVADRDPDVDDGAAHRGAHRLLVGADGERRAGRRRAGRRAVIVVELRRAARASAPLPLTSSGASASSVVRASPARTAGWSRIPSSWAAVGRQPGEVERRRRARRVRSTAAATSGPTERGRSPWPAAGRTAAAGRSRRTGGVDADAGARRLLVGARACRRPVADDAGPARRSRGRGTSSWPVSPRSASVAPPAMRNWASTRSTPVTCSVTVCSTWMRGLHSMNEVLAGLGGDEELDGAGVDVAGGLARWRRRRPGSAPAAAGRGLAPARPRRPSGCAAAPSSRGRRGARRGRGRRRGSGPRCGGGGRAAARRTRRRCRRPSSASLRQRSNASARSSGPVTARIPRPPPPAAALSITG